MTLCHNIPAPPPHASAPTLISCATRCRLTSPPASNTTHHCNPLVQTCLLCSNATPVICKSKPHNQSCLLKPPPPAHSASSATQGTYLAHTFFYYAHFICGTLPATPATAPSKGGIYLAHTFFHLKPGFPWSLPPFSHGHHLWPFAAPSPQDLPTSKDGISHYSSGVHYLSNPTSPLHQWQSLLHLRHLCAILALLASSGSQCCQLHAKAPSCMLLQRQQLPRVASTVPTPSRMKPTSSMAPCLLLQQQQLPRVASSLPTPFPAHSTIYTGHAASFQGCHLLLMHHPLFPGHFLFSLGFITLL